MYYGMNKGLGIRDWVLDIVIYLIIGIGYCELLHHWLLNIVIYLIIGYWIL